MKKRIVLIGNYPKDGQESMQRYTTMLADMMNNTMYDIAIWKPVTISGVIFKQSTTGVGKWFGYIDKWFLSMLVFKLRILTMPSNTHYHICDHSNAPYQMVFPGKKLSITCHDVLAIRGGLGFQDAYCSASRFGSYLQKWILSNLIRIQNVVCVSEFTRNQLIDLAKENAQNKNWKVIYNPFNAPFGVMRVEKAKLMTHIVIKDNVDFILHVGSNLPRKNKAMLVDALYDIRKTKDMYLCFAGQKLDQALISKIRQLKLEDYIVNCIKPEHEVLKALYNRCYAFVFPSLAEGFGWPIIEAQACKAPVITTDFDPMKEVAGKGALLVSPFIKEDMVKAILSLEDKTVAEEIIDEGFLNIKRFENNLILNQYQSYFKSI